MSYVKVIIHSVWGTKSREHVMKKSFRIALFKHMREEAIKKEIFIDFINGVEDHVHCLFFLNANLSISKTLQLIKGEASHWVNQNKVMPSHFEWADEYFAVSVSESQVDKVREYIKNQEEHHRKKTFDEECEEFMKKYGFRKDDG